MYDLTWVFPSSWKWWTSLTKEFSQSAGNVKTMALVTDRFHLSVAVNNFKKEHLLKPVSAKPKSISSFYPNETYPETAGIGKD